MTTGWRAAHRARRPHTWNKLQSKHRKNRVSKGRRKAMKESMRALRMKGLLP